MSPPVARIALLGSGTVGLAVLHRLARWQGTAIGNRLRLVYAANTRLSLHDPDGLCPVQCSERLPGAQRNGARHDHGDALAALGSDGIRILVDATADAGTAARHAACLAAGVHV